MASHPAIGRLVVCAAAAQFCPIAGCRKSRRATANAVKGQRSRAPARTLGQAARREELAQWIGVAPFPVFGDLQEDYLRTYRFGTVWLGACNSQGGVSPGQPRESQIDPESRDRYFETYVAGGEARGLLMSLAGELFVMLNPKPRACSRLLRLPR
jgi:hypothetical protein